MKRNKLKTPKACQSLTAAIAAGIFTALLLSILLTVLLTNFVLNDSLGEGSAGAIIFLTRAISVFVASLVGGAVLKQKYLLQVGFTVLGYLIMLLGIGIVFYDGSFKHFLSGMVSILVGGSAALLVLQRPSGKSRRSSKFSP